VEYFGAFNGNEWYFQIDENDIISYPEETPDGDAQAGNGQPLITCQSNPSDFAADGLPCGADANVVVRDDVTGKDRLYMTFGYFTAGSGPRTFWQVMEKIPE
jgi:Na+/H+ antiporter NhaD/arsenite permease-like protein